MENNSEIEERAVKEVIFALVMVLIATIPVYASFLIKINLFFALLPWTIVGVCSVIALFVFKRRDYTSWPFGFAIIASVLLTINYLKMTDLTSLIPYLDAGILTVSGIIFAFKELQNQKDKMSTLIMHCLFGAIFLSLTSISAAYISGLLEAASVLGTNMATFLLFFAIWLILKEKR